MRTINKQGERGTTVLETLIATAICTVVVFGLAGLVSMSTKQSREMGSTVAQATSLASQHMEVLMTLPFNSTRLNAGGSVSGNDCNSGYCDFLTVTGQPSASTADRYFMRRWTIANTTGTLKLITVRVDGNILTGRGPRPSAAIASYKSQQ